MRVLGTRPWSEWGSCSLTCGTGVKTRERSPCVTLDCSDDRETEDTQLCVQPECPRQYFAAAFVQFRLLVLYVHIHHYISSLSQITSGMIGHILVSANLDPPGKELSYVHSFSALTVVLVG